MRVTLNGTPRDLPDGATVADAAALAGVEPGERGVAVAVDGEVVARADWSGSPLRPAIRIEVVRATAGG